MRHNIRFPVVWRQNLTLLNSYTMRKIIILFFGIACSFAVQSQTSWLFEVNTYGNWKVEEVTPQINSAIAHKLNEKFAVSSFLIAHKKFGKGFLGLKYSVSPSLAFDCKVGVEIPGLHFQLKATVLAGRDTSRLSLFATLETGKDEIWWYSYGFVTIDKESDAKLSLGFQIRRYAGVGPLLRFDYKKTAFWIVPIMYDWEHPKDEKLGYMIGAFLKL